MKKLDKNIFVNVVLALLMISIFGSLISAMNNGFASVINKMDALYSALNIITGLLLNIPIVLFILGYFKKDKGLKIIAPILNLTVIFIIFIFAIVLAATDWLSTAGLYFSTIAELIVVFFIIYYEDFVSLIKKIKTVETKVEEASDDNSEEETSVIEEETTKE